MPIDPLYADSTTAYLNGLGQIPLPAAPAQAPSTGLASLGLATSLGAVQGAARGAGAAADFGAAVGQLTTGPDSMAFDPVGLAAADQQENIARAKGGRLFESPAGTNLYTLADMLRPDPTNTTRIDQTVQGAVSGLTQIVPAAALGGLPAAVAVGATSFGLGRAEDLKREGVDVGTRAAVGAVSGAFGAAGAVLPAGGSTIPRTLGLIAVGGPGMMISQTAAENAILRNAGYGHLTDQSDPLDGTNIAAATLMAGAFGGAHILGVMRGGPTPPTAAGVDPTTPLPSLDIAARRALPYDSPVLASYITQAAQREGVPPGLMLGLIHAGERSNSNQVSPKGAAGVAQMMPENLAKFGVTDPSDPIQSIDGMARYLAATQKQYGGNVEAMIADYNGGPRQAAAVLRGEAPPAAETAAYLTRVTDYLNNRAIDDFRFEPTPQQVDAALVARGQRIVDDAYVFGAPDDVNGMATHQDAFELAARQMDAGGFPDVSRYYTADDATRAAALDGLIADAEAQHTDLSTAAANMADPGAIAAARGELDTLTAAAPDTSPAAVKELTRQIQTQGVKFKAAAKQAQDQINALQADHEAKVARLRDTIQRNAEAQRANDQLPALNDQLTALRQQRAAIDVPATQRTQLSEFVARLARAQRETDTAPIAAAPRDDAITAAARTTPSTPNARPVGGDAGAGGRGDQYTASIDAGLRDAVAINPDLSVTIDAAGGERTGRLADIMQQIDDEHAMNLQDAGLFETAANCFITTLG
ncbi:lytic transglycosylase domain-containing protein [Burkholderia gladioli]|uniref:lytic transglycosylase domain-containing protein n=1 Tax=Burkholderia gladioli TaxID=28095 RepID=UPI001C2602F9|nr:lytic transglycosylase domain-containing protein [Burkholderia gladioli]MBU9378701.1 transglycosylase SLT domain-containing protein [Burkholderia gladioli]